MSAHLSYIDVTDDHGFAGIRASGSVPSDRVDGLERVGDAIRVYALDIPSTKVVSFDTLNRLLASTGNIVKSLSKYALVPTSGAWLPNASPVRGSYWLKLHRNQLKALDAKAAGTLDALMEVWTQTLDRESLLVEVASSREQTQALIRRLEQASVGSFEAPIAMPALPPDTEAAARRRKDLAAKWLRAADVASLAGSNSVNLGQYAMRMRKAGQVLGVWVPSERGYRYPPFQFDREGVPLQEMAELLKILPSGNGSGWSQADWFFAPHPRLQRNTPAKIMAESPARVLDVARRQFQGHPDAGW